MKSMAGFFDQARRNLTNPSGVDESQATKLNKEWLGKVRLVAASQPLIPPKIDPEVFESVSTALYKNQMLRVSFKNQKAEKKTAEVMPLGIAQQGTRMYLVCRFSGYDNERSLALNRINQAEVLAITFERPKQFNLKQYDDDGRFGLGDGKKIKLSFKITKPAGLHLLESRLSTDQVVTEHDDCYEIKATLVETAQLTWWLRGFGDGVWGVVKSPVG
jgi:predicted DNA-binding transcriptional regulator YafY